MSATDRAIQRCSAAKGCVRCGADRVAERDEQRIEVVSGIYMYLRIIDDYWNNLDSYFGYFGTTLTSGVKRKQLRGLIWMNTRQGVHGKSVRRMPCYIAAPS
jgi:hypothetical protein